MFTSLGIPTLAVVENMSYFVVSLANEWKSDPSSWFSHTMELSAKEAQSTILLVKDLQQTMTIHQLMPFNYPSLQ